MTTIIELEVKKQTRSTHALVCLRKGCFEKATHTLKVGRIQDRWGSDVDLCDDHLDNWDEVWRDLHDK